MYKSMSTVQATSRLKTSAATSLCAATAAETSATTTSRAKWRYRRAARINSRLLLVSSCVRLISRLSHEGTSLFLQCANGAADVSLSGPIRQDRARHVRQHTSTRRRHALQHILNRRALGTDTRRQDVGRWHRRSDLLGI